MQDVQMIKFCIKQSQKMNVIAQIHEVNIVKEQDMRLVENRQKIAVLEENFTRSCRMLLMATDNWISCQYKIIRKVY